MIVRQKFVPGSIFGYIGVILDGCPSSRPCCFGYVEDIGAPCSGRQGFGVCLLDGFALQSPFFGLLHVCERIDESAPDVCGSRAAIEVIEIAEEACVDILDVILGHCVIGIAVETVDGIEFDAAAGTDGRCRRNFFLDRALGG